MFGLPTRRWRHLTAATMWLENVLFWWMMLTDAVPLPTSPWFPSDLFTHQLIGMHYVHATVKLAQNLTNFLVSHSIVWWIDHKSITDRKKRFDIHRWFAFRAVFQLFFELINRTDVSSSADRISHYVGVSTIMTSVHLTYVYWVCVYWVSDCTPSKCSDSHSEG